MLTIHPVVHALAPGAAMGLLALRGVAADRPPDAAAEQEALERLRARYGPLERSQLVELDPLRAYVAWYRRFGQSYHLLAQIESVRQNRRGLNAGSALLGAMFAWELESLLLTAGHDLATLQQPLELRCATGEEAYLSLSGREVRAVAGDLMLSDGQGPVSSILRGPDRRSRITPDTREVLFTVYGPPGVGAERIARELATLQARLQALFPAAEATHLRVYNAV